VVADSLDQEYDSRAGSTAGYFPFFFLPFTSPFSSAERRLHRVFDCSVLPKLMLPPPGSVLRRGPVLSFGVFPVCLTYNCL